MKFSEVIKQWEDGWRGYAIDSNGFILDLTDDRLIQSEDTSYITFSNDKWDITEDLDEYQKRLERKLEEFTRFMKKV